VICRPPQATSSAEAAVNCAVPNPQNLDQLLVCTRSTTVYVMTLQGQVVRSYTAAKEGTSAAQGAAYVACATSPRGEFVYCLAEDGALHCFGTASGRLEHAMGVADKGPIGLCHHPHRNLLATCAEEGTLKTWKV
jgi:WD40 repeat-containing protein SMU1